MTQEKTLRWIFYIVGMIGLIRAIEPLDFNHFCWAVFFLPFIIVGSKTID